MTHRTIIFGKGIGRRGVYAAAAVAVMGGVAVATVVAPIAGAEPNCTASGLFGTVSSVSGAASAYLDAHPGANQVLTDAANMPPADAETAVRNYFYANPGEYLDLRNIAAPLTDLNTQCGTNLSPEQLITAYQAFQAG